MFETTTSRSIKSETTSSSASSQVVQDVLTTNYSPIASNEPQAATSQTQAKAAQDDYESDHASDEASGSRKVETVETGKPLHALHELPFFFGRIGVRWESYFKLVA